MKIRTLICLAGVVAIVAGCTQAHDPSGHSSSYDENWGTNLEAALTKAKEGEKMVFVDFTGSDWCPPCMALHDKVLIQEAFLNYAKENMELVVMDFPQRKQQSAEQKAYNQSLARKHNVSGYPTVIVFDGDGKEVHRAVGFSGQDAAGYVASLKKALNQ